MGSVVKLSSGKYAIRYDVYDTSGKRKQKQKGGFMLKRDALKALNEVENQIANNKYSLKADEMTVDDLIVEFLEDTKKTKAGNTYISYRQHCKDISRVLGHMKLSSLNKRMIEKALEDCPKFTIVVLKTLLNKALDWEYITTSPASRIKRMHEERKEMQYWNIEQMQTALDYLEEEKDETFIAIVKTALFTGLRKGEVLGLMESDFDFDKHTFTISRQYTLDISEDEKIIKGITSPKTFASATTLPLLPEAEAIIKSMIHRNKVNTLKRGGCLKEWEGFIFRANNTRIYSHARLRTAWTRFLKKHPDLPSIRWHDLRHTFATWLVANGVNMKVVQQLMRHSTFSMTADRYTHVDKKDVAEALQVLSKDIR